MQVFRILDHDVFDRVDTNLLEQHLPPVDVTVLINGLDQGLDGLITEGNQTIITIYVDKNDLLDLTAQELHPILVRRILDQWPIL